MLLRRYAGDRIAAGGLSALARREAGARIWKTLLANRGYVDFPDPTPAFPPGTTMNPRTHHRRNTLANMSSRSTRVVIARLRRRGGTDSSVRVDLASRLKQLIEARDLSQAEAAELLGMPQPKISAIRNSKLTGISLERLLQALAALGQHVQIAVGPSRRGMPAGIRVDRQRRKAPLTRSDHRGE